MWSIIELVHALSLALTILIIARALLSWVGPFPYNPVLRLVYRVTDPILVPIQSIVPGIGGIDFSPLIAIVLIQILERLIVSLLIG